MCFVNCRLLIDGGNGATRVNNRQSASKISNHLMRDSTGLFRGMRGHDIQRRHFSGRLRSRRAAELADRDAAVVRSQEIHEAPIVAARHAEEREQRLVAASRFLEPSPNELAEIVPGDIPREKQRIDVIPERGALLHQGVIEIVSNLSASIAERRQPLRGGTHRRRQVAHLHDARRR